MPLCPPLVQAPVMLGLSKKLAAAQRAGKYHSYIKFNKNEQLNVSF